MGKTPASGSCPRPPGHCRSPAGRRGAGSTAPAPGRSLPPHTWGQSPSRQKPPRCCCPGFGDRSVPRGGKNPTPGNSPRCSRAGFCVQHQGNVGKTWLFLTTTTKKQSREHEPRSCCSASPRLATALGRAFWHQLCPKAPGAGRMLRRCFGEESPGEGTAPPRAGSRAPRAGNRCGLLHLKVYSFIKALSRGFHCTDKI